MMCLPALILLLFPTLTLGGVPWIFACAQEGLRQDWMADQPMKGSVSQALVHCMVNHVMTSPYTAEELELRPSSNEWCLPDEFLSKNRTCNYLTFNFFEPIRYCVEEENFPDLSPQYEQDFNKSSSPLVSQLPFSVSTRLVNAMCALLEALRSNRGKTCLVEVCRRASHGPSQQPSTQPSITPSNIPSNFPSVSLSVLPSETRSMVPSSVASECPSTCSSMIPISQPSQEPTEVLSMYPMVKTLPPSASPSSPPSQYPTPTPTATQTWGQGPPFLNVRVTLRVLLDGVEPNQVPFPEPTNDALERALTDCFRSVQGFQTVEIIAASKAATPDHAPIVLTFRIAAMRRCGVDVQQIACTAPEAATNMAQEFRDAFSEALQTGVFTRAVRRQAFRQNATSFRDFSPRQNSSNLMSSSSFLTGVQPASSSVALVPGYIFLWGISLGAALFQVLA